MQTESVREFLGKLVAQIMIKTTQAVQAKQFLLEKERGIVQPTRVVEYMLFALWGWQLVTCEGTKEAHY